MPKRAPAPIRIEATNAPGEQEPRQVVYLYVAGYRLELQAPSAAKARLIAMDIAMDLGLPMEDE